MERNWVFVRLLFIFFCKVIRLQRTFFPSDSKFSFILTVSSIWHRNEHCANSKTKLYWPHICEWDEKNGCKKCTRKHGHKKHWNCNETITYKKEKEKRRKKKMVEAERVELKDELSKAKHNWNVQFFMAAKCRWRRGRGNQGEIEWTFIGVIHSVCCLPHWPLCRCFLLSRRHSIKITWADQSPSKGYKTGTKRNDKTHSKSRIKWLPDENKKTKEKTEFFIFVTWFCFWLSYLTSFMFKNGFLFLILENRVEKLMKVKLFSWVSSNE